MRMIPAGKDGTTSPHEAIQGLGHPNIEPLQAARQLGVIARLDDEVQMVALDGEMAKPEAKPIFASAKGTLQSRKTATRPQIPNANPQAQSHMHGLLAKAEPRPMLHA